jgi:superoxide reductase
MATRRDFIRVSLAVAGAAAAGRVLRAEAAAAFPPGLVFTKAAPGRWAGKEGLHAPQVTVAGSTVTVVTPHPMTAPHFIVKHTLLTPEGKFLGERTFTSADPAATSSYELPAGFAGTLWAASFCNLHDLWVTELGV